MSGVRRDNAAAGLMLGAVMFFSLMPLFVAWSGSEGSPFIFNAALAVGEAAGCAVFLMAAYRRLIFSKLVWRAVRLKAFSPAMLFWMMAFGDLSFFVWSTQYIDVSVASILFGVWPMALALLTIWLFRRESRYRSVSWRAFALFAVAFAGMAMVVFSQAGGLDGHYAGDFVRLGLGVVLVLTAAVITSFSGFGFKWASDFAKALTAASDEGLSERFGLRADLLELFGVMLGMMICGLAVAPMLSGIGLARFEAVASETLIYGFLSGIFAVAAPGILWCKANLMTYNLSVNVMAYLAPVISLGWLLAFSLIGDVSLTWLFGGSAAIVGANIAVYFEVRVSADRLSGAGSG